MSKLAGSLKKFPSLFQERWKALDLFDETEWTKSKDNPFYLTGALIYFFWIITIVSGLWLMIYYIPTKEQAYDSIHRIQTTLPFGSLIRGLHKYGADAIIILCTVRIYRMVFTGEYRKPKELSYIFAIVALLLAMYSGLTGYLLIWNQRAYWASKVFVTFPTYQDTIPMLPFLHWPFTRPLIEGINHFNTTLNNLALGKSISTILMGGANLGQATITRFYALHFAFSIAALIMVEIRFYRSGLKRMNLSAQKMGVAFGLLVLICLILPAEVGRRANPTVTPLPIFSDWYFLALYQMFKYMVPFWAVFWTLAIPLIACAIPFLDNPVHKRAKDRPFFMTVAISALLYYVLFSFLIIFGVANINRDPPYWYASMVVLYTLGASVQWWKRRWIYYIAGGALMIPFSLIKASPVWFPAAVTLGMGIFFLELFKRGKNVPLRS